MHPRTGRLALTIMAAALGLVLAASVLPAHEHSAAAGTNVDRDSFRATMRALWEDHIVWTRNVIVSVAADLDDAPVVTDRLLRNQDDIGAAIAPFYGDAAGNQLSGLLREHITGAASLLAAAKAGDTTAVETAAAAWYANGNAIADFLAAANPRSWPEGEMRAMMRDHLDLTLAEALARLEGRFADDVAAYDEIHVQILHMADMLSDGIIRQFPNRFAN